MHLVGENKENGEQAAEPEFKGNRLCIGNEKTAANHPKSWRDRLPKQKRIAIVGKAPDTIKTAPWNDPSWQIWILNDMAVMGEAPRWDVCFEVHPDLHAKPKPHVEWLSKSHGKPIFTFGQVAGVPDSLPLPVDEITGAMGRYINNTVSWMLAAAILAEPEEIGVWGVNMEVDGEYKHQKGSCEFFVGVGLGRGIRMTIPKACSLMKCPALYGIEENPLYPKMVVRLAELKGRVAEARAAANHWTTQRIALEGMMAELGQWEQFLGGLG